jgi:hypothetical protein
MVDTRVHRGGCPRKQGWEEDPCVTVNLHVREALKPERLTPRTMLGKR